jgi:hypothetical protein
MTNNIVTPTRKTEKKKFHGEFLPLKDFVHNCVHHSFKNSSPVTKPFFDKNILNTII